MKIAIAHQNPLVLAYIQRTLRTVSNYRIIWVSNTSFNTEKTYATAPPDLLLLDINLSFDNRSRDNIHPQELTLIQRIKQISSCAVVVVTQHLNTQAGIIFRAIGHGALDVIEINEPQTFNDASDSAQILLHKMSTIARLLNPRVRFPKQRVRHLASSPAPVNSLDVLPPKALPQHPPVQPFASSSQTSTAGFPSTQSWPPLVIFGASAGGPQALGVVLSQLPTSFPAAIIVVQHIDRQFAAGFASWLNSQTPLTVELVKVGHFPTPGRVWLAATNQHLVLQRDRTLSYSPEPQDCACHPSIDVFSQSVTQYGPQTGVAVLLTGMGCDGATGLKSLRRRGWHTIVQDAQTSAVYGMPKAAIAAGAAQTILPLEKIAPMLIGQHTKITSQHNL